LVNSSDNSQGNKNAETITTTETILHSNVTSKSSDVGEFVPFSMRRIRLMTRVELHTHPHSSRMRLLQNFFASL